MDNYAISLNTIIVWLLWLTGVAIIVYDIVFEGSDDIGHLGLAFIAGAVMRHVCCQMKLLDKRARDAFRLGQDSVRPLR